MNLITQMRDELAGRFLKMRFEIDAPLKETAEWFLDLRNEGGSLLLVVQWRPLQGFGVSTPVSDNSDYGSGPDEIYGDSRTAMERIVHLVESGEATVPPESVRLAGL